MRKIKIFLLLAAVGLTASPLHGQSSTQGAIGGTVFDTTDAVVPKATVTIHNDATNAEIHLAADESGFFKAPLVEPGTYTVTIGAPGFKEFKEDKVLVQVSQLTTVTAHLATGSASQVVEITSDTPILNLESPDFTSNLNTRALQDIPVNNLRWSSLALTTPGVVSDSNGFGLVSIRGISPILNNVLIDGADDNQAYYAEERGRTREAYSTPPAAIREFQVNTGVYAAEFGRAAGGVINSVTQSGGNQLHGQAYFYDRESAWGAFNPYTTNTTAVSERQRRDELRHRAVQAGGFAQNLGLYCWRRNSSRTSCSGSTPTTSTTGTFPARPRPNSPSSFFSQPDASAADTGATCNLTTGYLSGSTSTQHELHPGQLRLHPGCTLEVCDLRCRSLRVWQPDLSRFFRTWARCLAQATRKSTCRRWTGRSTTRTTSAFCTTACGGIRPAACRHRRPTTMQWTPSAQTS